MTMTSFLPLSEGFLLGIGLIIGIGPQNSFILQQCMKRRFVLLIAVLTSLIDVVLIFLGAGGAGAYFARTPVLLWVMAVLGATFLFGYGFKSFKAVFKPRVTTLHVTKKQHLNRRGIILGLLAVSLLNPSTYLDAMFVIGGSAARYSDSLRVFFTAGAVLASIAWFFGLSFGAARFAELFHSPLVVRLIEVLSGIIMWLIASRLLLHTFG